MYRQLLGVYYVVLFWRFRIKCGMTHSVRNLPKTSQQLLLQSLDHIDRHLVEVVLRIPAPLLAGAAVVHLVRPAVGDGLTNRVELVLHLEVRIVLLDGVVNDFRVEAHGRHVE